MKPAPLTLHRPTTLAEALETLSDLPDAKVLGGGQSLIPALSMRLASPSDLVDLTAVVGEDDDSRTLREIEATTDRVRVGALVTHSMLEANDVAHRSLPILREALQWVAHPAIRNRGTPVGSIVHADPSGEIPAIAALTEATITLVSTRGKRVMPVTEFILGAMEPAIEPDEIATAVDFGTFGPSWCTAFTEFARRSGDYALVGVGVAVNVQEAHIVEARASFVSVTDGVGALDLTGALGGVEVADLSSRRGVVQDAVAAYVEPVDDIHATAEYRRHLAGVLTTRALASAVAPHSEERTR